ncbi:predicted protein [Plenodomus lingam JN3]|uniref:Uncharacterized protein n=1 Tax=Leptosphaeria maculans (strain JN3 / isolate v23.1.3 / race Av1-4-5-6-7-8) TaxID=985895 RepID=E4ZGP0_LEPMJ|nr:predicted protein [Plenodomus lingam JN3]CBX90460.1 predicted protein [Plenodomus lingam JN3]
MAAVQCLGSVNSEHARQGREGQGRREVRRAVSAGPGVAQTGLRTRDMDTEILQRVMRDPHHWGDVGKLMVRSRWWQPVPLCPNEWEDGDEEERVVWSTHGFHSQEAMIAE